MGNKKILIIHCLPDDNPGGLAVLWGMMKALKACYLEAQYNLMSIYSSNDPRSRTAHRHITRVYPDLRLFGSILRSRTEYDKIESDKIRLVYKAIAWPLDLLRSLFGLAWPKLLRDQETVNVFREADIILSRGSHIVYDSPKFILRSMMSTYMLVFPFLLAKRLGKKYVMYAHSISPLHNRFNHHLFQYAMKHCHKILVREKLSQNTMLNDYKIDKSKVLLVPDAALAFERPSEGTKRRIIGRWSLPYNDFIAVTVVRWKIDRKKTDAYLSGMAETIDWLIETGVVSRCALVLQVHKGPADWECDREITEDLFQRIKNSSKVVVVEEDWIPDDLIALYGAAKVTMVTRFHSLIFSLVGGTPPLAISFSGPKTRGVMTMMDLEEYVMDQINFSFVQACCKFETILSNHSQLKNHIEKTVASLREKAFETPKLL